MGGTGKETAFLSIFLHFGSIYFLRSALSQTPTVSVYLRIQITYCDDYLTELYTVPEHWVARANESSPGGGRYMWVLKAVFASCHHFQIGPRYFGEIGASFNVRGSIRIDREVVVTGIHLLS